MLVKASYFPNWNVEGAEGPYRVAPNFMVVVPTANQVTLTYGTSWVEYLGYALTLLGLVLLVVLWRKGPVRYAPADGRRPSCGRTGSCTGTTSPVRALDARWPTCPTPAGGARPHGHHR